jgi:hypothetical protein
LPTSTAALSDLYVFFEELKSLSSNYTVISNMASASMFPHDQRRHQNRTSAATLNLYGAEAIWNGLQIVNKPFGSNREAYLAMFQL